jgi:hypothetical protein
MEQVWKRKQKNTSRISLTESGIAVTSTSSKGESRIEEIAWGDIVKVIAYKRDCYGFDLMCLAIGVKGNALEITEGMEGWDDLLDRAPDVLAGWRSKTDWYQGVMLPAFKANQTVIFSRT